MNPTEQLEDKLLVLQGSIRSLERVLVAYSGGVDSSLVASVAFRELGNDAVAALAVSPSLSPRALNRARVVAGNIGIRLIEKSTAEVDDPQYRLNTPQRCYFCKHQTYEQLAPIARSRGAAIVDGRNLDDIGDFRPGAKAADEHGVKHPLFDAQFTKTDIRVVAKSFKLPNWNDSAESCTSSRVLTGIRISPSLLANIQSAEAQVAQLLPAGSTVRVRHLGSSIARVEVGEEVLNVAKSQQDEIITTLAVLGYSGVTIEPYQRGSMTQKK